MTQSVNSVLWFVPAVLLALAFPVLWYARRGRQVDDHPLCRRCGFDQTGKPAESTVCAECGADLTGPRAVRVGHRQPRRGLAWTAALVLLLSAGWLAALAYAAVAGVDWAAHKPAWWLVRDAKGTDAAARDAALGELARRIKDGKLARPQVDELADLGLAHQADVSATWLPAWGNLVEAARAAGTLSDERWARYRVQAPDFTIEVRPTVRRGDPIPFYLRQRPARLGAASFAHEAGFGSVKPRTYREPSDAVEIGGRPVPDYRSYGSSSGTLSARNGGGATGSSVPLPDAVLAELPDGKHEMLVRIRVSVGDRANSSVDPDNPAVVTKMYELRAPVTLVPADRPTVTLNADPSHRPGVEKALTVREVRMDVRADGQPGQLNLSVNSDGSPIDLAYDVFVRPAGAGPGGREWRIGSVNFAANKSAGYHTGTGGKDLAEFDLDQADVVFRPSLKAAVGTTYQTQIWDGEVVVRNVAVKWTPPGARPATKPTTTLSSPASSAQATRTTG